MTQAPEIAAPRRRGLAAALDDRLSVATLVLALLGVAVARYLTHILRTGE